MASRNSSPANSVEAFAEPRWRGYTNENGQGAVDLQAVRDDLKRMRTHSLSVSAEEDPLSLSPRLGYITNTLFTLPPAVRRESACECQEEKKGYELNSIAVLSEDGYGEEAATEATIAGVDCDELEKFVGTAKTDSARSSSSCEEHRSLACDHPVSGSWKTNTRFSFFSSGSQNTIHSSTIGGLLPAGGSYSDLFHNDNNPGEGGVWWLDILNPNSEELATISKAFHLHPLTTEDIETQESREKVELFKHYYFISFQSFCHSQEQGSSSVDNGKASEARKQSTCINTPAAEVFKPTYEPVRIYMVVFRDGILTFTFSPNQTETLTHGHRVRSRIAKVRDFLSLSSDWLCYAMLDDIVDTFAPVINSLDSEAATIEDDVIIARPEDFAILLPQIGHLRKKVMGMLRLLGGKADVIKGFAKRCNDAYAVTPRDEIGLYLGDVQDHIVTMTANLSHLEKMLSRSHSNFLASLSMKNIIIGNHINESLSKITVLATILMPLNMISSLFGMNVKVPGQDQDGWFYGIAGSMLCVAAVAICVARRYKLL